MNSGRGIYSELKCKERRKNQFIPQKHQKFVQEWFKKTPHKGLLLYHRLGSGKTCSSIITADLLLELGKIKGVYVFTPGSLRINWIDEYCNTCGMDRKMLTKHYNFVTINYNVEKNLPKSLDNCLVIIDEAHNLINGYLLQSKNAVAIYDLINKSKCKVLALTGTPIYRKLEEWAPLANLLKPGSFPLTSSGNIIIDFFELEEKTPEKKGGAPILEDGKFKLKNPTKLINSMKGIVSYVRSSGGTKDYPEKIVHEPIKVKMTTEQQITYHTAYTTERDIINMGPPELPTERTPEKMAKYKFEHQMYIMAKQHIMTKRASNFWYPKDDEMYLFVKKEDVPKTLIKNNEDFIDVNEVRVDPNQKGLVKIVKPDLPAPAGWISRERFSEGQLRELYSPKMAALFDNILKNFNSKHVVYTFFKAHSGVNVMRSILGMCGLRTENYSGDLTDRERTKLLSEFNSPENRYGDKIKVLFVTDAGKEGISLLEVGHLHILEPDERANKIKQIEGRVVRFRSHANMPKEEQRVHIWRYWSMPQGELTKQVERVNPQGEIVSTEIMLTVPSIDEQLHKEGAEKVAIIEAFERLLIENSIESQEGLI